MVCQQCRHAWSIAPLLIFLARAASCVKSASFVPALTISRAANHEHARCSSPLVQHWSRSSLWGSSSISRRSSASNDDWVYLTDDGGVKKSILHEGMGDESLQELGTTTVTMEYTGTLAEANWSVEEVVQCWLAEQQGLSDLADDFRKNDIDEDKLTNLDSFNEEFVEQELGVTARIQCKKLVMAAKRLTTTRNELDIGHVFDSSSEYQYVLGGKKKLIRGMELGIASMKPKEMAVLVIRSDYAYGAEGYRKSNGDVMVPPFATLQFEIKILSS